MSESQSKIRTREVSIFLSKGNRPCQEDYVLVDKEKGIFIAADGFGGPKAGVEASKTACEAVRNFLFKEAGDLDATLPFILRSYFSLAGNVLFNSLIYANRKLAALNKSKNIHERGGASIIAGFIDGDLLAIANVGLCCASLIRSGKLVQLVTPRSYNRMIDPFAALDRDEAKVPMIAMGMADDLEPEIFEYKLKLGDWLIFNTDGLGPELLAPIAEIQKQKLDSASASKEILNLLNQAKYKDNAGASILFL